MSIRTLPANDSDRAFISDALLLAREGSGEAREWLKANAKVDVTRPLRVYRIPRDAIEARHDFLARAVYETRRYFVIADEHIAAVELAEINGVMRNRLLLGLQTERCIAAAEIAEQGLGEEEDYEARILEIRSLSISALWLQNEKKSWFVPLAVAQAAELPDLRMHSEEEFISVVLKTLDEEQEAERAPR
jgi:hypothetical protein